MRINYSANSVVEKLNMLHTRRISIKKLIDFKIKVDLILSSLVITLTTQILRVCVLNIFLFHGCHQRRKPKIIKI